MGMYKNKIYLSSPHMGGAERNYVEEAFDTNWVAPLGPNVNGFEKDLKVYLKEEKYVAAVNTGTSAIHLALILAGVEQGDSVICQSMTFSASANPILYQCATPIFIDSEIDTWNLSPKFLEEAILSEIKKGRKPKAIVAVHLYGMPYKVDEVKAIANTYDIVLIEDSAEALGSHYKEKKCGTFGDFGILSFNGNKIITTSGGGALVTSTKEVKDKALFLATQARDNAAHYQHSEIGYNYRMSNICAGIGRGQMEVLDKHVGLRRTMHDFYKRIFKNISDVKVFEEPSSAYYSNYWLSAILLQNYEQREALRLHLEKANIESRPLWKPMHLQPVFEEYPYYGEKVSEDLFIKGLCLPSGSNLSDADRDRIEERVNSFFN
jgi:dTDP-4-amino-4,6-dideoxygalactose transaminase